MAVFSILPAWCCWLSLGDWVIFMCMKKSIILVLLFIFLLGAGCSGGGQVVDSQKDSGLKKISVTADVELSRPGGTQATTCLGSGAFAFDFYVNNKEASGIYLSDGIFQLTDYSCDMIDSMKDCTATPVESAYVPVEAEGKIR